MSRISGNPVISMLAETLIELHGEALPRHGEPIDPEHALLDQATCRDDHSVILDALTAKLCEAAEELSPEFISLYYGEDVSEPEAEALGKKLAEAFPDAELTVVNGGQPVYYYLISIE